MNKKVQILIAIVVAAVIVTISCPHKETKYHNDFTGEAPTAANVNDANIKGVKLISDASGSMKGYVDFSDLDNTAKKNIVSNVSTIVNKIVAQYGPKEFSAVCGPRIYPSATEFVRELRDDRGFTNGSSFLWSLIDDGIRYASDSTVSVILSDMVLSYGSKAIRDHKDISYHIHHTDGLKAEIQTKMSEAKARNLEIVLIQYESDFNGRYYYNCQENFVSLSPERRENHYAGQKMVNRPYYLMLIGNEVNLKSIINNNCYAECKNIYASFAKSAPALEDVAYDVTSNDDDIWKVGHHSKDAGKDGSGFYSMCEPKKSSSFTIKCNDFKLPRYYYKGENGLEAECNDYARVKGVEYKNKTLKMTLKTDDVSTLKKEKLNQAWEIEVYAVNDWVGENSCDDDVNKLNEIVGKTWGLEALFDGIYSAYGKADAKVKVGSVKINYFVKD